MSNMFNGNNDNNSRKGSGGGQTVYTLTVKPRDNKEAKNFPVIKVYRREDGKLTWFFTKETTVSSLQEILENQKELWFNVSDPSSYNKGHNGSKSSEGSFVEEILGDE